MEKESLQSQVQPVEPVAMEPVEPTVQVQPQPAAVEPAEPELQPQQPQAYYPEPNPPKPAKDPQLRLARKAFSRSGFFALIVSAGLIGGGLILTMGFGVLCALFDFEDTILDPFTGDGAYLVQLLSYAIFIPIGLLVLRKIPRFTPESHSMSALRVIQWVGVILGLSTLFSLLSDLALDAIWGSMGSTMTSAEFMEENFSDTTPVSLLFIVVIGPIIEEFLFRKQLIDHTLQYGEGVAIVFSACMFGLFHGNFSQMFYTIAFGLICGYVYVRTGRLRYTIGIHIFNNGLSMLGTILYEQLQSGGLLTTADTDWDVVQELLGVFGTDASQMLMIVAGLYLAFLALNYALMILGVASLWYLGHHLGMRGILTELPRGKRLKAALGNPGVILFVCFSLGEALLIFFLYGSI